MKKRHLMLAILGIFAISLTCCQQQPKEIEKDEFVSLAQNTEIKLYSYATVKVSAKVKITSDNSSFEGTDEKINRSYYFHRSVSAWYYDSATGKKPLSNVEKDITNQCIELLTTRVKLQLKDDLFKNESTDGLTFYKDPLSLLINGEYVDYPITTSGVDGVINGTSIILFKYNNENGNITYYHEKSKISRVYVVNRESIRFDESMDVLMKISYSDKK